MKYLLLCVAIVAAAMVIGTLLNWIVPSSGDKPVSGSKPGFREMIKNPNLLDEVREQFAARAAIRIPDDIADEEIQVMVDRLFLENDDTFNFERLQLVGRKAVPHLIHALRDPHTWTLKFTGFGESAFKRICDLLGPIGSPAAVNSIAKYLDHPDPQFRQPAALALGEIGLEECIEAVEKALNDEDDYVRTWGMMGIRRAIDRGGASPAFREAVFPRLVSLLDWDSPSASGHAPELLLRIDIERAEPILLSRAFFTARNPQLAYIIRSLNRADRKVPHPLLLPLLDELHGAENFRHELGYAEALIAYALNPDAQADCRFQTALTSTSKWIRPAAAESLAILHGIRDASGFAFRRWDDRSFDHLSQPQKYFCAVSAYNTEVNNGGHHQYFLNSSGDLWKSAVAGLHAIGANVRAEILKEAVTAFGEVGPLEERQMRCQQLAALSAEQDEVLGKLDDRYFECTEDVDVLLSLYAIKHKSHFSDQLK